MAKVVLKHRVMKPSDEYRNLRYPTFPLTIVCPSCPIDRPMVGCLSDTQTRPKSPRFESHFAASAGTVLKGTMHSHSLARLSRNLPPKIIDLPDCHVVTHPLHGGTMGVLRRCFGGVSALFSPFGRVFGEAVGGCDGVI